MSWLKKPSKVIFIIVGLALFGAVSLFYTTYNLPNPEEIANRKVIESTKIYDRTGQVLLYEIHGEEKRTIIPPEDILDFIKYATISVEDDAFYSHPAFDWRGILRALTTNLLKGRFAEGGSTITQQLAKTAFLSSEKTISRKIKELVLASRLEQRYSKDEILDLYLNQVPYGSNAYGIEAAAQTYFNKHAKEITLGEAALLASLPKAPSYYSPWGSHISELEDRRRFILRRMRELGYIDEEQSLSAQVAPKVAPRPISGIKAPHFVLYVQDYLTKKYGSDLLEAGGLRITTTLDWSLQQTAEQAIKDGVRRNSELYGGENGALVAEDPTTGQILALVGSKDYFAEPLPKGCTPGKNCKFEGNFSVATQGLRQPGSALKPFVYLTLFEQGFAPETILWDTPTEFSVGLTECPPVVDFRNENQKCYHPENFDGAFRGPIKISSALAQSINVPAVKALYLSGLDRVLETLSDFGITTLNDKSRFGLSLVLGGGEVKLIELVRAYSVVARDGVRPQEAVILKVESNNDGVLEEFKYEDKKVVEPNYARLINDVLSDVELRAPLYSSSLKLTQVPGHQVALKTGTTNDYRDAWTVGYTPNLVAGVWVGNNNREPLTSKGGSVLAAVPLWHNFMTKALEGVPLSTFPKPDAITSSNPAIRGDLVQGEFHDILYYLGRVNDPQFNNWEEGVKYWLSKNTVDLNRFRLSLDIPIIDNNPVPQAGDIQIKLNSPNNGDYMSDNLNIDTLISSKSQITKIEAYFNNELVDSRVGSFGDSYEYKSVIIPSKIEIQNLLVIRAVDSDGSKSTREIIIFRR
ncbi:MAG: transglycosylase domain-containing protein [Candidatus Colwellbacteria bacterium]|nr:transglycosylase domain-containing protein [Candidatus Colwellbacteria bacterium]MBI3273832.1 transglycosylase domain-containing protein [Candidatus Colwellbacteria bacterium]